MNLQEMIMGLGHYTFEIHNEILNHPEQLKELDRKLSSELLQKVLSWDSFDKISDIIELIFEYKVDVNPLDLAIARGDVRAVEIFLSYGAKLKDIDFDNQCIACCMFLEKNIKSSKDMLKLLLKNGLTDVKKQGVSILFQLGLCADERVDLLLEFAEILVDSGSPLYNPPIICTTALHYFPLLKFFIKKGADVNHKHKNSQSSPLHRISVFHNTEAADLLLLKGANVNARDSLGCTPLHNACRSHNEYVIDLLLLNGANVCAQNKQGKTPFSQLEPRHHYNNYDSCAKLMVKELAKLKFQNTEVYIPDMSLIKANPIAQKHFDKCMNELQQMSSTRFYGFHSYYSMLMSKNIKKLARLMKNQDFLTKFEKGTGKYFYYGNDLQRILVRATQVRDESQVVYSRLFSVFRGYLPEVIIEKLADNFNMNDLPSK